MHFAAAGGSAGHRPFDGTGLSQQKSPPDGYTVVMATPNSHTTGPHVLNFPYDPIRDFTPITLVMQVPSVLVVNKSLAANSMQELVAIAKASPGKLNYYSSGIGSIQHLAGEMFNLQAGVKVVHVPYKGSAPAIADVLGGSITMGFDPISATLSFIEAGSLKPLGHRNADLVWPSRPCPIAKCRGREMAEGRRQGHRHAGRCQADRRCRG